MNKLNKQPLGGPKSAQEHFDKLSDSVQSFIAQPTIHSFIP